MSKSYSKNIFLGVCYGSNTEYYRKRRQLKRRRNKQHLRNALQFEDIDENLKECNMPTRDSWDEPTDGGRKYTAKELMRKMKKFPGCFNYFLTKKGKIKK
jgi:hypothetical protein